MNNIKEGWLTKMGGFFPTWKRRWFVLEDKTLIYSTMPGVPPKGIITIDSETVIELSPECKKQPSYKIDTKKGIIYYIKASTLKEAENWIKSLKEAQIEKKNNQSIENLRFLPPLKILAKCNSGFCFQIFHENTEEIYVIKRIYLSELEKNFKKIHCPIFASRPPNIIPIISIFENDNLIDIIMPFIQGISLEQRINQNGRLSEQETIQYSQEILCSLMYFHEIGFYFGDLHPSNIIIDLNGHIRLIPPSIIQLLPFQVLNPSFTEPELINGQNIRKTSDYWSLGCIIYYMITGQYPFYHRSINILYNLIRDRKFFYPDFISINFKNLINFLLKINLNNEININDFLDFNIFKNINWNIYEDLKNNVIFKPNLCNNNNNKINISIFNNFDVTNLSKIYNC